MSCHLHIIMILRKGEWYSNTVVVPQLHCYLMYLLIGLQPVCLVTPVWWGLPPVHKKENSDHYLYIFNVLNWEDRILTFVGCPLGFSPVVSHSHL